MKKLTLILGIIVAIVTLFTSCTQKTCPTYSNVDDMKIEENQMFI